MILFFVLDSTSPPQKYELVQIPPSLMSHLVDSNNSTMNSRQIDPNPNILRVNCQLVKQPSAKMSTLSPSANTKTNSKSSPITTTLSYSTTHHYHPTSSSSSIDCNLDQIHMRLSPLGRILWVDTSRVTTAAATQTPTIVAAASTTTTAAAQSPTSSSSSQTSSPNKKLKTLGDDASTNTSSSGVNGILIDAKNNAIKNVKFIDYVHTNDLNHVHKHINDGKFIFTCFILFTF